LLVFEKRLICSFFNFENIVMHIQAARRRQ